MEDRICSYCNEPLDPMAHGNQHMHPECAYKHKMEKQKTLQCNQWNIMDTYNHISCLSHKFIFETRQLYCFSVRR